MGWQQTNVFYWYIMVFLGLSAALAIYFIILAYQIYKPSHSSIYEYSYLISAGFFGWLFWDRECVEKEGVLIVHYLVLKFTNRVLACMSNTTW